MNIRLTSEFIYPGNKSNNFINTFDFIEIDKNKYEIGLKNLIYPSPIKTTEFINLHCSLVNNDINSTDILKSFKPFNNQVFLENPQFFEINNSSINKINIYFTDQNFNTFEFEQGVVITEIYLKKKK